MFRIIQLVSALFPLLFITTIKSDDVVLTQQTPEKAGPGEEFVVEVNVEKGDIEGFAKFQFDLPEGFVAEQVDTKGATFTFDDQTIKLIWLSLPSESAFTFTYKVRVPGNPPNELEIGGKFSYLQDNNRMIAELKPAKIQLGTAEEIAERNTPGEEKIEAKAEVSRTVEGQRDGTYLVTVNVSKQGIDGFSKIEEVFPEKFEVTPVDENEGVFSYVRTKAKFVWMNTPENNEFSVQYKVDPGKDQFAAADIQGEYAFLDENETKKVQILNEGGEMMAGETGPEEVEEEEAAEMPGESQQQEPAATEKKPKEKPKKAKKGKKTEKQAEQPPTDEVAEDQEQPEGPGTTIPEPEQGISYRVQILAGHKLVGQEYFSERHSFEKDFYTENHEGWVKYTVGGYGVYKDARDKRVQLNGNYNLPGPFVAAYNNGQRITVQEALMITNQQWHK